MIRKFIGYYKPHRKLFFIDMLCAFIVALCDLFYPVIAKDIINEYVPSQNLRLLLVWAGVLLGIYALKALLNYIIQYWAMSSACGCRGICGGICSAGCRSCPFRFTTRIRRAR